MIVDQHTPNDPASMGGRPVTFAEVMGRSVYGTAGYLSEPHDLIALERVIVHNLPVLGLFRRVVVATNYGDCGRAELATGNAALWRRYFPDCVLLDSPVNRGHSVGTSDLDNLLFDYCSRSGVEWLCKSSNDVLLSARVLQIPVVDAAFYYLNAVSYNMLRTRDFDLDYFARGFLFPQTTFYAIDVSTTDYLVDKEFLERSWEHVQRIPNYSGRIWEYVPGWSCEYLLRQTVLRNELTRSHLMSDDQWQQILHLVIHHRITDCSFKDIQINGICHTDGLTDSPNLLAVVS
ncbi:MAG: hypothetical protein WCI74_03120 [Actinomycetes bacterium]